MKKTLIILLILFSGVVSSVHAQSADIHWLRRISQPVNVPLDNAMKFTSNTVTPLLIGIPAGVFVVEHFIKGEPKFIDNKVGVVCVSLLANEAITFGLKYTVNRARPYVTYPDITKKGVGGSKSFPSGHTSNAFALATSLSLAYPEWYVIAPAYAWACTVGYSRMRLGMHYPSDVACGAIIGAGCAWATWWINKKIQVKKRREYEERMSP